MPQVTDIKVFQFGPSDAPACDYAYVGIIVRRLLAEHYGEVATNFGETQRLQKSLSLRDLHSSSPALSGHLRRK